MNFIIKKEIIVNCFCPSCGIKVQLSTKDEIKQCKKCRSLISTEVTLLDEKENYHDALDFWNRTHILLSWPLDRQGKR